MPKDVTPANLEKLAKSDPDFEKTKFDLLEIAKQDMVMVP